MINIKNIFRLSAIRLHHPRTYRFCSNKKPEDSKGVSLSDISNFITNQFNLVYNKMIRVPKKYFLAGGILGILIYYLSLNEEQQQYPKNYFQWQLKHNQFQSNIITVEVRISKQKLNYRAVFTKGGSNKKYYVSYGEYIDEFKNLLQQLKVSPTIQYQYKPNLQIKLTSLIKTLDIISVVFITAFFIKSSSVNSVRKGTNSANPSNFFNERKVFEVINKTNVKFQDVAGLDQSKVEVMQFVDFLKNPQRYAKLGARIPKGVLLTGPPGTGKTMLAKACAGQAGVPFIATSGSDFVQIFVGVGASRVRDLFALAKQKAPSIIFIDEIDAVGRKRSGAHSSHDQRDNTLNQILVEMDGFDTKNNVIVMAATNRQNLLDSALIRPGRFDRIVEVNLPDLQGRRQIFNVHLEKVKINTVKTKDQYSQRLATLTPGFSGAQIANLCNEAAILAARKNKNFVDASDLQVATQRIIGGIEKKSIISIQEKKTVAIHQSGHAVVSWFLEGADPLLKLTIIPRSKGSLGFAQYFVNENKLNTKTQLIDRICFILGGRCAEQHFLGKITNGASDDLKKAYEIAHSIVVKLGMNERIGYIGYKDPQYLRPYSQSLGNQIDTEIKKIIHECTERTKMMIKKHQQAIKKLSDQLFEKETLTVRQIRRILGERPFISGESYEKYLQVQKQF